MTAETAQGISRCVFDFGEEGKYRLQMDHSQDGKEWETLMEGTATRGATESETGPQGRTNRSYRSSRSF